MGLNCGNQRRSIWVILEKRLSLRNTWACKLIARFPSFGISYSSLKHPHEIVEVLNGHCFISFERQIVEAIQLSPVISCTVEDSWMNASASMFPLIVVTIASFPEAIFKTAISDKANPTQMVHSCVDARCRFSHRNLISLMRLLHRLFRDEFALRAEVVEELFETTLQLLSPFQTRLLQQRDDVVKLFIRQFARQLRILESSKHREKSSTVNEESSSTSALLPRSAPLVKLYE